MTITVNTHQKSTKGIAHIPDGKRMLLPLWCRIGSSALALAALLVWFAPGTTWESDVMLFKFSLSLLLAFMTVGLWQLSSPPMATSVEVDIAKMEIRVVRNSAPAAKRVMERYAFAELENVDLNGRHIIL